MATSTETNADVIRSINSGNVGTLFPDVVVSTGPAQAVQTPTPVSSKGSDEHDDVLSGHDEEQIKLMEEVCIVLDYDDKPLGAASKKTCHIMPNIEKGLLHRAFSVFLFNSENKLLLQQRATEKITFPDMWTNTCCSHPLSIPSELGYDLPSSIQGVKTAASRKLEQELGIPRSETPSEKFNFLTRIHYQAPSNGIWGEHEIDYILFIKIDPTLNVNRNEVRDEMFVSASELKEMFKDSELKFTPWFKLICENYLFKWWNDIDNIKSDSDDTTIHRML